MKKLLLSSAALSCGIIAAEEINFNQWQVYCHRALTPRMTARLTCSAPEPVVNGKVLKGTMVNIPAGGVDLNKVFGIAPQANTPAILVKKVTLDAARTVKLGCGADWWFEAYCNGNIIYSTLQSGGNVAYPITGDDNVMKLDLKRGKNLIAIFLKSGNASFVTAIKLQDPDHPSGGVSRRLEIAASTARYSETLRHGPWLTAPDIGSIMVNFMTDSPMGSAVEYRQKGSQRWLKKFNLRGGWPVFDQELHRIKLDKLVPGAEYEYRAVLMPKGKKPLPQTVHTFTAVPKETQEFTFFTTGDTQFGVNKRGSYIRNWQPHMTQADFHVNLGDLAAIFDDYELMLFGGYMNYLTPENYHGKPFVAIRGNHELRGIEASRWFELLSPDKDKGYYSFCYGDVFFAVLDTGDEDTFEKMGRREYKHHKDYMLKQYNYFQQAVNSPEYIRARYRIILSHGGAYSHNPARLGLMAHYLMEPFVKASEKDPSRRIHLHLAGHIHRYRRSVPGTAAVYSTSPVGPEITRSDRTCDFTVLTCAGPNGAGFEAVSCSTVRVTAEKLEIKSYDAENRCFDHFAIDPQGKVTEIDTPLKKQKLKLYK